MRKLDYRLQLITAASARNNCVYMYANLKGGDGNRLYFDGSSMITSSGRMLAQAPQFSIDSVDVVVGVVDLDKVRNERVKSGSRGN